MLHLFPLQDLSPEERLDIDAALFFFHRFEERERLCFLARPLVSLGVADEVEDAAGRLLEMIFISL